MHTDQSAQPALPLRSDTMLGVCEALGQDFGFHPNWLRLVLGSLVLWSPWVAFGVYIGLGLAVALSRLIAPQRSAANTPQLTTETALVNDEGGCNELPLAA